MHINEYNLSIYHFFILFLRFPFYYYVYFFSIILFSLIFIHSPRLLTTSFSLALLIRLSIYLHLSLPSTILFLSFFPLYHHTLYSFFFLTSFLSTLLLLFVFESRCFLLNYLELKLMIVVISITGISK